MTPGGWVVLLTSVVVVVSLAGFCFWRVLTAPAAPEQGDDDGDDATA